MADSLRDRIREALSKPLDPDGFEACAVELLRPRYASLDWVRGPNDAGQDGLGETHKGTQFLFVVTTARDFTRNLRRSIRSYQDADGERIAVVLATSRPVSGRKRLNLRVQIENEFDVELLDVHDRETFVGLLAEDPPWRLKLLRLSRGPAGALTREFQRDHADLPLDPVGRDAEFEVLDRATGDLIVFGEPGAGKSFLLEQLCQDHGWGWLVREHNQSMPELADEIMEKRPKRIIVDDAQFSDQLVPHLIQLRREIERPFDIVACCWESETERVASLLPTARLVEVPLMERTEIRDVLREMGVNGPLRLVAEIIGQARGRVGLAVTLARATLDSNGWEVVTGRVLTKQALAFNQRLFSDEFLYELGVIALLDEQGLSQVQIGEALGRDHVTIAGAIRRVASSGTIDNHPHDRDALRVQPRSLRFGLVREAFFGGPGSLDLERVLERLESPKATAIPLIVVAATEHAPDRGLVTGLIDWNDAEAPAAFAQLGLQEFAQAAASAPQHLGGIARSAIDAHGLSGRLLRVLLKAAESTPPRQYAEHDHPLAIIRSRLTTRSTTVAERLAVAEAANRWAAQGGSPEVSGEAAAMSLTPAVDEGELEPVERDRILIHRGVQPVGLLRELDPIWDQLLNLLRNNPGVPPRVAFAALHPWVRPEATADEEEIDAETRAVLRQAARRVIPELATIFSTRPIAMRRLSRMARHVGLEVAAPPDPFTQALYGYRDPRDDNRFDEFDEPEGGAKDAVRLIAERRAHREPSQLAAEISNVEEEAAAVGVRPPPLLRTYVAEVAARLQSPISFAHSLADQGSRPPLVVAATSAVEAGPSEEFRALVERLCSVDDYRRIGTRLGLQEGGPADVRALTIDGLRPEQAGDVAFCFRRGLIDAEELRAIVEEPESRLGQNVALRTLHRASGGDGNPLTLSGSLYAACHKRVASYRPGQADDIEENWMLAEQLRRDPELCVEWIEGWLENTLQHDYDRFPSEVAEVAADLPPRARRRLLDAVPAQLWSIRVGRLVRGLVEGDDDLMAYFFGRDELAHLREVMFKGDLDESWLRRAQLASEAGCPALDIAEWTLWGGSGWTGAESAECQRRIGLLDGLRDRALSEARTVALDAITASIAAFERRKSDALRRERRARVFGREW
ncbi:MAG: hypothetical protein OXT70_15445 [Chloroflexota bacterium]|nr:hypothetical protein [Chloroflexota bacterium]